jgi:hypothetical protein
VLRAQSNRGYSKAGLRGAHGSRHNSANFYNGFWVFRLKMSVLKGGKSYFASAAFMPSIGNLLVDVPVSC